MRVGMILPRNEPGGGPLTSTSLADGARRIERTGFHGEWVFDALNRGFILPDPLTALAVAGTVTERVELGTCILQLGIRGPVEVAHRVMTTHLICGDRLSLGVAPAPRGTTSWPAAPLTRTGSPPSPPRSTCCAPSSAATRSPAWT